MVWRAARSIPRGILGCGLCVKFYSWNGDPSLNLGPLIHIQEIVGITQGNAHFINHQSRSPPRLLITILHRSGCFGGRSMDSQLGATSQPRGVYYRRWHIAFGIEPNPEVLLSLFSLVVVELTGISCTSGQCNNNRSLTQLWFK